MSNPHPTLVVLIVEDELLVRSIMAEALQEEGFRVIEASNVAEALVALEAQPDISIVLTDVEMPPGARGYDLATVAHQRWPHIRFVVTSGRMWPNAHDMPATAVFLPKPWTSESLVDHVWEAVERAKVARRG